MKKARNFKGIAAVVMAAALFIQGQMAFAADFSDGSDASEKIVMIQNNSDTTVRGAEQSTYISEEKPTQLPLETPTTLPAQTSTDTYIEMPSDIPIEGPSDNPVDTPSDTPAEMPDDSITEEPSDIPGSGDDGQQPDQDSIDADDIFSDESSGQTEQDNGGETPEEQTPACSLDFVYEDSDVIIKASASQEAGLPEHAMMSVMRLAEGMPEYEEAKAATAANLGAKESADYAFYDVTFIVDGQTVEPPKGTVSMNIEFRAIQMDSTTELQKVVHIENAESQKIVSDVTAAAGDGENMKSADFAF